MVFGGVYFKTVFVFNSWVWEGRVGIWVLLRKEVGISVVVVVGV